MIATMTRRARRIDMWDKLQRLFYGRYGNDRLNQFLFICALLGVALSFFGVPFSYLVSVGLMAYAYFRMFSRNVNRRAAENQWYLRKEMKFRGLFQKKKREFGQRKEYRIFRCPNCRQKLRVPRGKGHIAIRCRKCGHEFIRNS